MRVRPGRIAGAAFGAGARLAAAAALAGLVAAPGAGRLAAAPAPVAAVAAAPRVLYLVRHAAYDEADPRDPRVGKGLTPFGLEQARRLGARLAASPVRFASLRSSPLARARQTAIVLADELGGRLVEIDPRLEECSPPSWRVPTTRGLSASELVACRAQLERLVTDLFRPSLEGERHELVVAHGNVIRYLVTRALRVDPQAWLEMSIGNASLSVLRIEADGSFRVVSVGDVGHLPAELQSGAAGDPEPTPVAAPAPPR